VDDSSVSKHTLPDNPDWHQLYNDALARHNALAYEMARRAIVNQLLALPRNDDSQAREELMEALRQLVIHENK
jgi:hypothetical protein